MTLAEMIQQKCLGQPAKANPANAANPPPVTLNPIAPTVHPGDRITWQGSDGKAHDGVVDFLQTYPGEVWAFCTRPDGEWSAVNVKYLKGEDAI